MATIKLYKKLRRFYSQLSLASTSNLCRELYTSLLNYYHIWKFNQRLLELPHGMLGCKDELAKDVCYYSLCSNRQNCIANWLLSFYLHFIWRVIHQYHLQASTSAFKTLRIIIIFNIVLILAWYFLVLTSTEVK